jgi:acyl-CoA thioesterase
VAGSAQNFFGMQEQKKLPQDLLAVMLKADRFSKWLGLEVLEYGLGYCKLQYRIVDEMLNGFDIVHGGVLFSASDSALAFACNSHGRIAVALDATINFARPAKLGDLLTVEATEIHLGEKISIYDIQTHNQNKELIAIFKGTAYRTSKQLG